MSEPALSVPREKHLYWGRIPVPLKGATSHFFVAGASGSGKTILLERLLYSALHHENLNPAWRFLIYDPKQDAIPTLCDMLYGFSPTLLNPLDSRADVWDLHEDIDTPSVAREFACTLVPDEKENHNPFFSWAVQDLITGSIVALRRSVATGAKWTFRDLLWLLFNTCTESGRRDFERVVSQFSDTERLLEYFATGETASNIRATIMATLSKFEPVAASWQARLDSGSGELFSFKKWCGREVETTASELVAKLGGLASPPIPVDYRQLASQVVILGIDETSRTAVDAINRAMFIRFTQIALSRPNLKAGTDLQREAMTWVFLDETREAGHLETLTHLLNKGRSKGIAVALGFQDIQGLKDAYGETKAEEMIGQCSTFAVLRLRNPATAEWASSLFGDYYTITQTSGESVGTSVSMSRGTSTERRRKLLDSDFFNLPTVEAEEGVSGYFECPWISRKGKAENFNPRLHIPFKDALWKDAQHRLLSAEQYMGGSALGHGPNWGSGDWIPGYVCDATAQSVTEFNRSNYQVLSKSPTRGAKSKAARQSKREQELPTFGKPTDGVGG